VSKTVWYLSISLCIFSLTLVIPTSHYGPFPEDDEDDSELEEELSELEEDSELEELDSEEDEDSELDELDSEDELELSDDDELLSELELDSEDELDALTAKMTKCDCVLELFFGVTGAPSHGCPSNL